MTTMEKVMKVVVASLMMLAATGVMAQSKLSALEGTWLQIGQNGLPTLYGKSFLPDGRLYGFCLSKDFSNTSTWIMADYKVLDDSTYHEHVFFHSAVDWQRDIMFNYHRENDSTLVTSYTNIYPNGQTILVTEYWKRVDAPMDEWTDEVWQSTYQQTLIDYGRVPREWQNVEDKAKELYDSYQRSVQSRNLDAANEALLIRAELDSTNLGWQNDVLDFYLSINAAPAITEKISNRAINLCKAQSSSPTDSTIVNAYIKQGFLYLKRGVNGKVAALQSMLKAVEIEKASNRPARKDVGVNYFVIASTYCNDNDFESVYNYARQSAVILDAAPDAGSAQKGEAHYLVAWALNGLERFEEALDEIELAIPLFVDDKGQPLKKLSEVNLFKMFVYRKLVNNNPKDKKLLGKYQQFMEDKMVCVEIANADNRWGLKGSYYALEVDNWDMNHLTTTIGHDARHFLLQKDGKNYSVDLEEGESLNATTSLETVDRAWKQQILKQWRKSK